jgi:hypothetical protein
VLRQQFETLCDVTTLHVRIAARTKLALAPGQLVTDMGQAMLVQPEPSALLVGERHEPRGELGAECLGNDGKVKR